MLLTRASSFGASANVAAVPRYYFPLYDQGEVSQHDQVCVRIYMHGTTSYG